jgi:hypothetical protein
MRRLAATVAGCPMLATEAADPAGAPDHPVE